VNNRGYSVLLSTALYEGNVRTVHTNIYVAGVVRALPAHERPAEYSAPLQHLPDDRN